MYKVHNVGEKLDESEALGWGVRRGTRHG